MSQAASRAGLGILMRRKQQFGSDDLRPDYDFDYAKAVRGECYHRLRNEGSNVVVLEPDVARAFRNSAAVNDALGMLLEMMRATRRFAARPGAARYGIPDATLDEQVTTSVGNDAHCQVSRFDPSIPIDPSIPQPEPYRGQRGMKNDHTEPTRFRYVSCTD
jgi:hypothetical protein